MANFITRTLTAIFGAGEPTTRPLANKARLTLCSLEGRDVPAVIISKVPALITNPPSQTTAVSRPAQQPDQRHGAVGGFIPGQADMNAREVGLANRARDARRS